MSRQMQVIFESQNGDKARRDGWLDYCREPAPMDMTREEVEVWANGWCNSLKRRERCEFRFRIEVW